MSNTKHTPRLCPECHHLPSFRVDEHYGNCYCKCHDVADAAPDLLAACKEALEFIRIQRYGSGNAEPMLLDAIAKAEGA